MSSPEFLPERSKSEMFDQWMENEFNHRFRNINPISAIARIGLECYTRQRDMDDEWDEISELRKDNLFDHDECKRFEVKYELVSNRMRFFRGVYHVISDKVEDYLISRRAMEYERVPFDFPAAVHSACMENLEEVNTGSPRVIPGHRENLRAHLRELEFFYAQEAGLHFQNRFAPPWISSI